MLKHYVAFQVWQATRKASKGQSLVEYGLVLALIACACIVALTTMGTRITGMLNGLSGTIGGVNTAAR